MNFRPMGRRVLVKADTKEQVSKGGVILPDSAQERPNQGRIVRLGPDCQDFAEGDHIMFIAWAGIKIRLNDEPHMVMAENEVLGLLTEDD